MPTIIKSSPEWVSTTHLRLLATTDPRHSARFNAQIAGLLSLLNRRTSR